MIKEVIVIVLGLKVFNMQLQGKHDLNKSNVVHLITVCRCLRAFILDVVISAFSEIGH